jgi:hypothetical protein
MIVVVLLGILSSIGIPQYFNSVKQARFVQCMANRGAIDKAVFSFIEQENVLPGETTPSIPNLIGKEFLTVHPKCASGGVYFWTEPDVPERDIPRIGCSVHWVP